MEMKKFAVSLLHVKNKTYLGGSSSTYKMSQYIITAGSEEEALGMAMKDSKAEMTEHDLMNYLVNPIPGNSVNLPTEKQCDEKMAELDSNGSTKVSALVQYDKWMRELISVNN